MYPLYRFESGGRVFHVAVAWALGGGVEGVLASASPGLVLMNAAYAAGPVHVATAFEYAVRAFDAGINVAKRLHVEVMLFAAATREISRALELFEPGRGAGALVVVAAGASGDEALRGLERCGERGLELSPPRPTLIHVDRVMEAFGLTEEEVRATPASSLLEAVEKNVLARMALEYISR